MKQISVRDKTHELVMKMSGDRNMSMSGFVEKAVMLIHNISTEIENTPEIKAIYENAFWSQELAFSEIAKLVAENTRDIAMLKASANIH